jgi:hypothetical protein
MWINPLFPLYLVVSAVKALNWFYKLQFFLWSEENIRVIVYTSSMVTDYEASYFLYFVIDLLI